ncbi:HAUS augmin-like complex subunit 7 [Apostichopus japonicus]|uniref:HAUS augmin-like complex subunit 7 n=1 Tax=Stichopus japonicus TaxID=307972 RepID=UPI003AB173CE
MAEISTQKKTPSFWGKSFKERLTLLGCPYTDGVDETWISELLFQQGEARIRLLQWLFSRYDVKLSKLLDDQYYGSEARLDSRLQKLLSISSMLGLCHPDDIELIRGSASSGKQAAFWDKLLDIVSITDMSEDPHRKAEQEPGIVSDAMDLQEQFSHDCLFISSLAHQRDLHEAFAPSSQALLPPDLLKVIKRRAAEHEETTGKRATPPSLKELDNILSEMKDNVIKSKEQLDDLKTKYKYESGQSHSMETVCQTLKLVLSELAQLITTFINTFEAEMRPWCNRNPPRLTPLGPSAKRVHGLLQEFKQLLEDLQSVRNSFQHLTDYVEHSESVQGISDTLSTIASVSDSALQSYSDLTGILEESSHTAHTESVLQPFR